MLMMLAHCAKHPSQWMPIESIAGIVGYVPQTLYYWVNTA